MLERYYKELLGYLRRKVPDQAAAADLAQEAYVRIYASHPEQAQIHKPRNLLYKVAHNLVIDHYRQQQVRAEVIDAYADANLLNQSIGPASREPEAVLSSKERLACLEAALAALPPRPREAFVLYKIDGLSRAQVAEQMGIGVRTVETHLEAAMAACSKALHLAEQTAIPHHHGHGAVRQSQLPPQ